MTFLRVELVRQGGDQLIESDFGADVLDTYVRTMVSIMIDAKIMVEGEKYRAAIIPRAADSSGPGKPAILENHVLPGAKGGVFIERDKDGAPFDRVGYLTTQIHLVDKRRTYQFDVSIGEFMDHVLAATAGALLADGTLAEREPFRVNVSVIDVGRPRVDADVLRKLIGHVREGDSKSGAGNGQQVPDSTVGAAIEVSAPQPNDEEVNIVIESVEDMVKPFTKPMSAYRALQEIGKVGRDELPIYFRRGAYEVAKAAAGAGAKTDEEIGGFLVGNVLRDPENDRLFVDISQVIAADQARGTYVSLHFGHEAWREVLGTIERDFPNLHTIGWYHTHLVSQTVVRSVPETLHTYLAEYLPFFSAPDRFIHRSFFRDPWHVALVLDVNCKQDVFFAWGDHRIRRSGGYYLYGDSDG